MLMKVFEPLHAAYPGRQGFVSLQGDPTREDDPRNIINEALEDRALGGNFIAKIPPSFPSVSLLRLPERAQLLVGGIRVLLLPLLI